MSSRLPPLNPLRAFEATARRGSVSAAARELNVTHGAISHQIRALELSFNAALFERGGKRLKLTSQGALLLPAVTHAFEGIAAATAAMTRPTTSGELRIVCVPALLSFWMIPRLHQFTEAVSGRSADADRLKRCSQPVFRRCRYLPALWRRQLAGLLGAAVEPAGTVSGRQPDAAQHVAAAVAARPARSCHPAW